MVKYNQDKKEKLCKKKKKDKLDKTIKKKNFKLWIKKVDKRVYKKLNMHLSDLPDEDFWNNWNNGMNYKSMANHIIQDQYNFINFMIDKN